MVDDFWQGAAYANRSLRNVFEAADARQKQAKKRSLYRINEHFEPVFNTAAATQIVFAKRSSPNITVKDPESISGTFTVSLSFYFVPLLTALFSLAG